jgi:hypothetical protein
MAEKLTYEEFVKQAILKLRTGNYNNYKGIHTVYSGFNEAFRKYFDGANPIEITNQLAQQNENRDQAGQGRSDALFAR